MRFTAPARVGKSSLAGSGGGFYAGGRRRRPPGRGHPPGRGPDAILLPGWESSPGAGAPPCELAARGAVARFRYASRQGPARNGPEAARRRERADLPAAPGQDQSDGYPCDQVVSQPSLLYRSPEADSLGLGCLESERQPPDSATSSAPGGANFRRVVRGRTRAAICGWVERGLLTGGSERVDAGGCYSFRTAATARRSTQPASRSLAGAPLAPACRAGSTPGRGGRGNAPPPPPPPPPPPASPCRGPAKRGPKGAHTVASMAARRVEPFGPVHGVSDSGQPQRRFHDHRAAHSSGSGSSMPRIRAVTRKASARSVPG